jgi:Tol biopolymer transport system component
MTKLNTKLTKLAVIFSMLAIFMLPTAAQAQFSGTNGRIISYGIGAGAVSILPTNLNYFGHNISFVNSGNLQRQFVYSPDGSKIAYSELNGSDVNLYIKSASSYADDGTQLTTATAVIDGNPAFSSDGTKIAFNRQDTSTGKTDIYVVNADGTGLTRLTQDMYTDSQVFNPIWSNDDSEIYVSMSDGGSNGIGIYSISPAAANQNTATSIVTAAQMNGEALSMFFDVSPDNNAFVYNSLSGDAGTLFSIRKVNADGTSDAAVATSNATTRWFVGTYSPDGTKIVTMRNNIDIATYDMVQMNPDGTSKSAISTGNAGNTGSDTGPFTFSPSYSPFWGTNQDTYPNTGSFGEFDDVGAPNTTSVRASQNNYLPILIASLSALGFIALVGFFIKKEYISKRK